MLNLRDVNCILLDEVLRKTRATLEVLILVDMGSCGIFIGIFASCSVLSSLST